MTRTSDDRPGFPVDDRQLALGRPHNGGRDSRAWDAADEQLVAVARQRLQSGQRVAIVDDSFGALALGLVDVDPVVIADSAALGEAVVQNALANHLRAPNVRSWEQELAVTPSGEASAPDDKRFDAVILKVPRQLDYLEFLLRWVNQVLSPEGWVLTGGMIKHLPDQAARVYQRLVTTDTVLPARKKARLVLCRAGTETLVDWRGLWKGYALPQAEMTVNALPAVFARDRLDIGTRELLPFIAESMAQLPGGARVLDLACGNGILGLSALSARPDLSVTWADISAQAVCSARTNLVESGLDRRNCQFVHADGVPGQAGRYQRILLNPPFHDGGAVGDHIALRLFSEAAGALAPAGELLMVGNRHLGYHKSLRAVFSDVQQLQATPKFVVFRASGPRADQRGGRS